MGEQASRERLTYLRRTWAAAPLPLRCAVCLPGWLAGCLTDQPTARLARLGLAWAGQITAGLHPAMSGKRPHNCPLSASKYASAGVLGLPFSMRSSVVQIRGISHHRAAGSCKG